MLSRLKGSFSVVEPVACNTVLVPNALPQVRFDCAVRPCQFAIRTDTKPALKLPCPKLPLSPTPDVNCGKAPPASLTAVFSMVRAKLNGPVVPVGLSRSLHKLHTDWVVKLLSSLSRTAAVQFAYAPVPLLNAPLQ